MTTTTTRFWTDGDDRRKEEEECDYDYSIELVVVLLVMGG
jgi:hypothetical protein